MISYIYKITLLEDTENYRKGQIYIGKCSHDCRTYFTGGVIPKTIAKKYGKHVFKKEIIVQGDFNNALLNELERHYIRLYNSNNVGLNLTLGGDAGCLYRRPLYQYDLEGNYLNEYKSLLDATKAVGGGKDFSIAVDNPKKSRKGFKWKSYKVENCGKYKGDRGQTRRKVDCYNLQNEYIKTFNSITEASIEMKVHGSGITNTCSGYNMSAGGYKWKYVN